MKNFKASLINKYSILYFFFLLVSLFFTSIMFIFAEYFDNAGYFFLIFSLIIAYLLYTAMSQEIIFEDKQLIIRFKRKKRTIKYKDIEEIHEGALNKFFEKTKNINYLYCSFWIWITKKSICLICSIILCG